jgi:predicted HAD superfamily Cof-like phosphohydrolase
VKQFMQVMGQEVPSFPALANEATAQLRVALIAEELEELKEAIEANDIVEIADALTDLLYVVYGAGHAYGIDLDPCFDEVHDSNMTKIQPDGTVLKNASGKVIKPETYRPPNLDSVIAAQVYRRLSTKLAKMQEEGKTL